MKTLKYIALAALTLSFAACEQEDFNPAVQGNPDAVKINATIGDLQTRVSYSSTNGETSFANGDAIKVVNLKRSSKNEATYTTTDGTNWTTSDAMVWNSSSFNQFQAWYPVADYSSFESFTIPEGQSDAAKLAAADWMTAETEDIDKPENCVLNLNFQHRLTKVTVTVTQFTSQFASDATLSGATIYSLTADNVTMENGNNGITPYQEDKSVTAIICPGKYNADATLMEITVKDVNGNYTLTVPVNAYLVNTGLEAGSHYTFSLKVGKEAVSISSVTVADWNKDEINGGVAEEVTPSFSVSANQKVLFAPGNLQYNQTTQEWSFADEQWESLGAANINAEDDGLANVIDLFGWSTDNSANNFGISISENLMNMRVPSRIGVQM